jgi:hypothetical protein
MTTVPQDILTLPSDTWLYNTTLTLLVIAGYFVGVVLVNAKLKQPRNKN